jgi:hypothetical protein
MEGVYAQPKCFSIGGDFGPAPGGDSSDQRRNAPAMANGGLTARENLKTVMRQFVPMKWRHGGTPNKPENKSTSHSARRKNPVGKTVNAADC